MPVEPILPRQTTVSWLRCNGQLRNASLPCIVDASQSLADDLTCETLSARMGNPLGLALISRIVLSRLRAIICPDKKLGGTAFATPPYKTRWFFYLKLLCLTGTSCQSALPKKPWPIGWCRWRARDRSFRTVSSRGLLDAMPRFSSQILRVPAAYAGTSTWRSA